MKISEITGYTIEELLSDKEFSNNAESTKLKIINSLYGTANKLVSAIIDVVYK